MTIFINVRRYAVKFPLTSENKFALRMRMLVFCTHIPFFTEFGLRSISCLPFFFLFSAHDLTSFRFYRPHQNASKKIDLLCTPFYLFWYKMVNELLRTISFCVCKKKGDEWTRTKWNGFSSLISSLILLFVSWEQIYGWFVLSTITGNYSPLVMSIWRFENETDSYLLVYEWSEWKNW